MVCGLQRKKWVKADRFCKGLASETPPVGGQAGCGPNVQPPCFLALTKTLAVWGLGPNIFLILLEVAGPDPKPRDHTWPAEMKQKKRMGKLQGGKRGKTLEEAPL